MPKNVENTIMLFIKSPLAWQTDKIGCDYIKKTFDDG